MWFCTACGFPTLDAHRRSAERMAWAAQRMRAADFLPGLQIANTLGHGDLPMWPAEGATWPRMVGHDGKEAPMCACPRSAELHAYLREMVKAYAAWQPSSVWIDDDLRMHHHPPVNWACFCDRCLGAFAWETRHEWDRGPLVEALNERDDGSLRLAWTQFNGESLALVARTIAQAVHEVAPDCRLGLQHAGPEWGLYNGASLEPVFKMLAEVSGHPVGSRPGGGFYHDHRPREMITKALELGRQVARLSGCVDRVYAEVENFTHVAMGKTPHGTVVESSLDLALGCRGLSFAILCSGHELPAGYEPILARIAAWRAFWEQYVRANANTMPGGLEVVYGMNHAGRLMDADEKPFAW
ncbi:MAG: hypothetical protein FJ388_08590, partial [Verrucomicrobia bacterium]|nr:hypothetical protein [Verrucomicrobiota bacterium]